MWAALLVSYKEPLFETSKWFEIFVIQTNSLYYEDFSVCNMKPCLYYKSLRVRIMKKNSLCYGGSRSFVRYSCS